MSVLPENEQSTFAEFYEEIHNGEISSDGGGESNSDHDPEMEDSESDDSDMDEAQATSMDQIASGRSWQEIPPKSGNKQHLSRKGSLTRKSEHVESFDECFHLFINTEMMDNILLYTNKKAAECMPEYKKWRPLDRTELDAFFGLLLLIGRFRESREDKQSLWSENNALSRRYYAAIMSRERFSNILRFIRFDDFDTREERKSSDKLAPLRQMTDMLIQNCKDCYDASNIGCVTEQLIPFRGRCSFKVCMPRKPGKYGIKIRTLCDAKNFYCCNMDVYLGKQGNGPENGQGHRVVKQLVDFWKNSGRCLITDNFFTDISLGEELLEDNIFLVGPMRKNRRDLPRKLVETKNRVQYSSYFLFTENTTLVSYIPKPRNCIVLLSTLHHGQSTAKAEEKFKPDIIKYYDSAKSGVDVLDKLMMEYTCRRCTRRWPLALFMHYLDVAAYNSFVIWQTKYPTCNKQSSIPKRRNNFVEELARKLTEPYINRRASAFENQGIGLHKHVVTAIEATGRKIAKKPKLPSQTRARCCFCIGSNNRYSNKCDYCQRHVCSQHSCQTRSIVCDSCYNVNLEYE